MSPFDVRRERFHDVVSLLVKILRFRKTEVSKNTAANTMEINGQIYTEAQNDDWY